MRQQAVREGLARKLHYLFYRLRMAVAWRPEVGRQYAAWLGVDVGEGAVLFGGVSFGSEPWLIKIGNDTWVTAGTQFITHDGSITVLRNGPFDVDKAKINRYGKITVGDNCFIGVRCIIMPNVRIGSHCIVAAGSVVTKNIPDGTIVGGNPARVIGSVADFAKKVERESLPIPSSWPDVATKRRVLVDQLTRRDGEAVNDE